MRIERSAPRFTRPIEAPSPTDVPLAQRFEPPGHRITLPIRGPIPGLSAIEARRATLETRPIFHRIVEGPPASGRRKERLEYLYGARVVFAPKARPARPIRVRGTVLHDDPFTEPSLFIGESNPALLHRALHARYADKWEELELLRRIAPDLAPPTLRSDTLAPELGAIQDPRTRLIAIEAALRLRFEKYILKTRSGYGSDGELPTHEDDFAALWDRGPGTKRAVLEALASDPASVLIQPFIAHRDELRVHVVEGRILKGATVGRWAEQGRYTDPEDVRRLETRVERMLESIGGMSFAADVLVTGAGFQIIDLNAGLESGMFHPDGDVFVTNLLAERFTGRETPYLRDLRAFERAPLVEKLGFGRKMERIIGGFVRKHEAYGFYDRLVDGYLAEVERDPRPEIFLEAWRQLDELETDEWELERFLDRARCPRC